MATLLDSYQFPIFIVLEHIAPLLCIVLLLAFFIKRVYLNSRRKTVRTYQTKIKDYQNLSLYHQVAESIVLDNISPDIVPLYISTNTP
jgi:hypothetical protein